jgi:flagellar protein FlbD
VVKVTRFDGSQFYLNADLIELIEETPDTVVTLSTGRKVVVREPAQTVVERVIQYRRQIHAGLDLDGPAGPPPVQLPDVGSKE